MREKLLELLCCPKCKSEIVCNATEMKGNEVVEGDLTCQKCVINYSIENGIPRFVDKKNYSSSFGYQWNKFKAEQLDSRNGTDLSAKRFYSETQWTAESLKGKWVLDAGCGAGRFLDVASEADCEVVGIDISTAIDASKANLSNRENVHFVQASIYELPFKDNAFDGCYCIGVIQHTPNPEKTIASLPRVVRENGELVLTIYERKPWTYLFSKYWLRFFTKDMPDDKLLKLLNHVMPFAFPITDILFRIPVFGKVFKFLIPIANYVDEEALSREQRYSWAILDTFDMLAPQFDNPQNQENVEALLAKNFVSDVQRLPNPGLNLVGRKSSKA